MLSNYGLTALLPPQEFFILIYSEMPFFTD